MVPSRARLTTQLMRTLLRTLLMVGALALPVLAVGAGETITVYKDPG
jgi:hypothetical protein